MASAKLLKLAATTASLFSLVSGVPYPTEASTPASTVESVVVGKATTPASASAAILEARDELASEAGFLNSIPGFAVPHAHLVTEGISDNDLEYAANLLGITAAQMAKVQMESSDPELEEPANGIVPSNTSVKTATALLRGTNSVTSRDEPEGGDEEIFIEKTNDEIEVQKKLKKSQSTIGFWVSLVNGTPYRWKLLGMENKDIDFVFTRNFPRILEPGESATVYAETLDVRGHARLRYLLLGTKKKSWLTLTIEPRYPHNVNVRYGGALKTVGNGEGSVVDLGTERGTAMATYFLAGREDRFYDNNASHNWMKAMMCHIGNYTLRDVMLPRSHHAGMYTLHKAYGFGGRANSFTQDYNIYEQLTTGGVRVIDSRFIMAKNGSIFEGHGVRIAGMYHGTAGVSHDSMIRQINKFNDEYPGELIIIDVHGDEMRAEKKNFKTLDKPDTLKMIESFKNLKHRAVLVDGDDMTKMTLNKLIGGGKSAVVIRMVSHRVQDLPGPGFPGAAEGFVTEVELPYNKHWSNAGDTNSMFHDQLDKLFEHRKNGNADPLYASDFIVTQKGWNLIAGTPITDINGPAWVMLIVGFWNSFKDAYYPNWLAMDAIRASELKGLAITVNQCFVAKRCGKLRGRVPSAPPCRTKDTARGIAMNGTTDTDVENYGFASDDRVNSTVANLAGN